MVRAMKRVLLVIVAVLVVGVGGAAAFLFLKKPAQRPASTEKVDVTPARVERGKYLAETALQCMHCHTAPDPTRWSGYGDQREAGAGGLCWDESTGFPGQLCSPNITPDKETGIGAWTDGELMRAIREGIDKDGQPLFAVMAYKEYRLLPDEDVRSLVAYLRSLPPVKKTNPERKLKPPLNVIVKFMPKPLDGPVGPVDKSNSVAYGKYLTTVTLCSTCHTPVDKKHIPIPGQDFAGGQEFKLPWFTVKSANLTPHATGLGTRTKEQFIAAFRAFAAPELQTAKVEPLQNTVMPWVRLARMTDEDLGAIYDYLRTVPAIDNAVEKRPPPTVSAAATAPAATP
jgi:hypothetical protein